ncbi:GNAT family N-acetyltransferase, partial [Streptomyces gardneri]|uniref:GNAT family N-acetyltransferase n=1 Tax=Streptomyces gardneri TaxID=66892 RepID=UPI0036C74CA7
MIDPTALHAGPTPTAPALVLRPWRVEDAAALVEVYRDRELRRWSQTSMECEDDGVTWVQAREQDWAAGVRFDCAVLEAAHGSEPSPLVGNVVLKEVAPGKPSAEVGYPPRDAARPSARRAPARTSRVDLTLPTSSTADALPVS